MREHATRWLIAFAMIAGLVSISLSEAPLSKAVPPYIHTVRTDGTTLVWVTTRYLSTLNIETIATGHTTSMEIDAANPDVSGENVVWQEYPSSDSLNTVIAGKNLRTGTTFQVSSSSGQNTNPAISGSWVVWEHEDVGSTRQALMARNLDGGNADTLVPAPTVDDQSIFAGPVISGTTVVWADRIGTLDAHAWEVRTVEIGSDSEPRVLASNAPCEGCDTFNGLDIGGHRIVYGVGNTVWQIRLPTPTSPSTPLMLTDHGSYPTTDGRYVFWVNETPTPDEPNKSKIVGEDLQTDSMLLVTNADGINTSPYVRDGRVAWVFYPYQTDSPLAQSASIASILPTAPQPNPHKTDPNWTYYPQTQRYLSYGFRDFWQANGGLPVFGYPKTKEFSEYGITTQYFERERFEWHPDNPAPYTVELGRLGVAAAAASGQSGTAPFTTATTVADPGCVLFSPTKHEVCGAFLRYWQTHGLNFGDVGTSYHESLALFGYPISEKYVDPSTGLQTQFFERAVMEWHPANPDPWKVELRLVGNQQLQSFGW